MEDVRDVQKRGGRLADGAGDHGMAVTERGDGDAGGEVEVFTPIGIPHAGALAAHEEDR